jgi:hypothetical protein
VRFTGMAMRRRGGSRPALTQSRLPICSGSKPDSMAPLFRSTSSPCSAPVRCKLRETVDLRRPEHRPPDDNVAAVPGETPQCVQEHRTEDRGRQTHIPAQRPQARIGKKVPKCTRPRSTFARRSMTGLSSSELLRLRGGAGASVAASSKTSQHDGPSRRPCGTAAVTSSSRCGSAQP